LYHLCQQNRAQVFTVEFLVEHLDVLSQDVVTGAIRQPDILACLHRMVGVDGVRHLVVA